MSDLVLFFQQYLQYVPKNLAAQTQLAAIIKLVRRLERAIASPDDEPVASKRRKLIAEGGCEWEPSCAAPMLAKGPNG